MADTTTPNYNLVKPEVGGSDTTWGNKLNGNFDILDAKIKEAVDKATAAFAEVGSIRMSAAATMTGYLIMQGQAVSRTDYAALYAILGTAFGAGDGVTTFNIPDARAMFIRGLDAGKGIDTGRALGTVQQSDNKAHIHTATAANAGNHAHGGQTGGRNQGHTHAININTGTESAAHNHNIPIWNGTSGRLDGPGGNGVQSIGTYTTTEGENQSHYHNVSGNTGGESVDHVHGISADGTHTHTLTVATTGIAEARPTNLAFNFFIKT